jgi:hypothetical protein
MMQQSTRSRSTTGASALAVSLLLGIASQACEGQSTLPSRYADSTFWRMSNEFSEPSGFFRSDNLLSNEASFQWVVPSLQKMTRPDGVYLGVAPEQNFTFIAALKPKVAFIIDIRRGNLLEHLMYKSLFEMSSNRVDFAFRLFGRQRPAGTSGAMGVEELMTQIASTRLDTTYARSILNDIKHRLVVGHGFTLSSQDSAHIDYVYQAFSGSGPGIRYNMQGGGYNSFGNVYGRGGMPNYADLMTESDSLGEHRSYLASDESFALLKDMEARNVIIPFTGDFAGPKALRAFGKYVRDNKAVVQAIYVSNVEQYLFQSVDNWRKYYENVATLPTDSTSVFIRSATNGYVRQQSPNSRQNELLCPVAAHMKAFNENKIGQYYDVFSYCR